jgi:DnaJ-class molecular chaperone
MEKLTPVRKIICYECKGNGFLHKDFFEIKQCKVCDSEGELLSDGKTHMKLMKVVDNARMQ